MGKEILMDRIVRDPAILVGKPVIRGARIPVSLFANCLVNGRTLDELLSDYPTLTREDFKAAVQYSEARARELIDFSG